MERLILVAGFSELWPNITRCEQLPLVSIDYLRNHLNDGHVLREVPDFVNIDIYSLLFFFLPEIRRRVLFLIVRDKLSCILSVSVRFEY